MAGHAWGMGGSGPPAEPAAAYPGLFATERDRLSELPAAGQAHLAASGNSAITGILLRTRAIIGTPEWARRPDDLVRLG